MSIDKLMHLGVGLAVGASFWQLLERYAPAGVRRINPIIFLIMLIWGASGLFFFRKLHIPILDGQFFYMAVPDWDIPLYNATRLRFLIHRSWLFHSVLIPIAGLMLSLWGMQRDRRTRFWRWGRDGAIALSVGMTAHLIWDALLSETKRGFIIHNWNHSTSVGWLVINLIVGLMIPFGIIFAMKRSPNGLDEE